MTLSSEFLTVFCPAPLADTVGSRKCLLEITDEIACILKTNGKPDEALRDSRDRQLVFAQATVTYARRMKDQGVGISQ